MIGQWVWGAVPAGFSTLRVDPERWIVVRQGWEHDLDGPRFFSEIGSRAAASPFTGRGRLSGYRLESGEVVVVRAYRHGGMLGRVTGEMFFTWPPRPFKELNVTEGVRRRGVPTLELVAACVRKAWGPCYRGWLVSRELEGGLDLWAALRGDAYVGDSRRALLGAVASTLRAMHERGVYHSDLNLKNILVRTEPAGIQSYVIDFDKARLFDGAVPRSRAAANLKRLRRSARKLDPLGRWWGGADWELLLRLYREAGR